MLEIFGKQIKLKEYNCDFFERSGEKITEPSVYLYIQTKGCNSRCEFCEYYDLANDFNFDKFEKVLGEISSKIRIKKFGITGGEPTLNWGNFTRIISLCKQYNTQSEFSLNTNGARWYELFNSGVYKDFHFISLSRHHYNWVINNEILKSQSPNSRDIIESTKIQVHPLQIQLKCNLISGYIDSTEEIIRYLNWANVVGINECGFSSLMPINTYSKENFVDFSTKELLLNKSFFLTKSFSKTGCVCKNYVYLPNDNFRNPIRIYHKNAYAPENSFFLTYDGSNLRRGFSGEIIF